MLDYLNGLIVNTNQLPDRNYECNIDIDYICTIRQLL